MIGTLPRAKTSEIFSRARVAKTGCVKALGGRREIRSDDAGTAENVSGVGWPVKISIPR